MRIEMLALLLLLAFINDASADDGVRLLYTKQKPEAALPVQVSSFQGRRGTKFTITFAVVDPSAYRLDVVVPKDENSGGASLERFYLDENPVAVMVGGFIESYGPATPAGLLRVNGRNLNPISMKDIIVDGVVCVERDSETIIVPRNSDQLIQASSACFQSGPLLIYDRKLSNKLDLIDKKHEKFSSGAYPRSFFLKNSLNQYIMGVTSPISLFLLRRVMLMTLQEGGFDAVSAIGLPGLQWGGLIVKPGEKTFQFGQVTELLPDALAVFPR
jgi:hypothetical protein